MTVELVCAPSRLLVPAVHSGRVDLAIVTRLPNHTYETHRRESLVWVAAPDHTAWEVDPLSIALFEPGCGPAHAHIIEALDTAERAFRMAYSSASLSGLIAVVEAGLAVAGASVLQCAANTENHWRARGAAIDPRTRNERVVQPDFVFMRNTAAT